MKIICPYCKKITELEHVARGCNVECVCSKTFVVDHDTTVEEYTEIDSILPEHIGQYPITEFIGYGGMGKVYKGIHPNLGIPVAIKALRLEYLTDKASIDRFIKSAKICAKLNHPNVVRIYDCGYDTNNDNVYLVMEYIGGGSAQDLLERDGFIEQHRAAEIAHETCLGLMAAEFHGIVHRDIKPENIMFAEDGTIKVLDMGLAKIEGDARISNYSQTISFTSLGTEQYMPPEQAIDARSCDSRADIYSLGISLYQMCTGQLPFNSEDPQELRRMHATVDPEPPSTLKPDLHPDLEYIILKCIQKKRDDRYSSIDELELDLDAFLKSRILPSRISYAAAPAPEEMPEEKRSGIQWKYAFLFLLMVLILSVPAYYLLRSQLEKNKAAADTVMKMENKLVKINEKQEQFLKGLAPMLVKGNFPMASEYYRIRNGETHAPELKPVLMILQEIPYSFAAQWKNRTDRNLVLTFRTPSRRTVTFQVEDVIGETIYAVHAESREKFKFTIKDIIPEEQQTYLQNMNPTALAIWLGSEYAEENQNRKAEEYFRQAEGIAPYLAAANR